MEIENNNINQIDNIDNDEIINTDINLRSITGKLQVYNYGLFIDLHSEDDDFLYGNFEDTEYSCNKQTQKFFFKNNNTNKQWILIQDPLEMINSTLIQAQHSILGLGEMNFFLNQQIEYLNTELHNNLNNMKHKFRHHDDHNIRKRFFNNSRRYNHNSKELNDKLNEKNREFEEKMKINESLLNEKNIIINTLKNENKELNKKNIDLNKRNNELNQKNIELNNDISVFNNKIKLFENEKNELLEQINNLERDIHSKNNEILNIHNLKNELQTKLDIEKSKSKKINNSDNNLIEMYKKKINGLEDEIYSFQNETNRLNQIIDTYKTNNNIFENNLKNKYENDILEITKSKNIEIQDHKKLLGEKIKECLKLKNENKKITENIEELKNQILIKDTYMKSFEDSVKIIYKDYEEKLHNSEENRKYIEAQYILGLNHSKDLEELIYQAGEDLKREVLEKRFVMEQFALKNNKCEELNDKFNRCHKLAEDMAKQLSEYLNKNKELKKNIEEKDEQILFLNNIIERISNI